MPGGDDKGVSAETDAPRALLRCYDEALPAVYGYFVRRCGDRGTAEDLTSETFLAAMDAARRPSPPQISVPWLIGVARHKLADHYRRRHDRFTVPVAEATSEETLAWLRQRGIRIFAATPHAEREYTQADMSRGCAIVVGTEQYGLSDRWMQAADERVKIPMLGQADSLNVSNATTILLYEAVRQRRSAAGK